MTRPLNKSALATSMLIADCTLQVITELAGGELPEGMDEKVAMQALETVAEDNNE